MESLSSRKNLVWGSLLILFGVVGMIEMYTDLGPWAWVVIFAASGLGVFTVFLSDRSDWWLLIPTYVLWVLASLIALITLKVLVDPYIAAYVLMAIALPFLVVFFRDRAMWWALIPAFVLGAIGILIPLLELGILRSETLVAFFLIAIAVPFLVVYVRDRSLWWALIPAYTLIAIGVMVWLVGLGTLQDTFVAAYVMFAIAIPFLVVFVRDRSLWWALIPGGIMAIIGLSLIMVEAIAQFLVPAVLIIAGGWVLLRQFTARNQQEGEELPAPKVEVDPTLDE